MDLIKELQREVGWEEVDLLQHVQLELLPRIVVAEGRLLHFHVDIGVAVAQIVEGLRVQPRQSAVVRALRRG